MKRFVIGDIHGAYKALKQCLERSNFNKQNDLLITIGDVVDGYPESYEVVEELLTIHNRIDIRGNHDDWFNKFIETGFHPDQWSQGGLYTAKSYAKAIDKRLSVHRIKMEHVYGFRNSFELNLLPEDIAISHQNFFKNQHYYYKDDNNNIFVHGGFDRGAPIKESPPHILMWDRDLWKKALSARATNTKLKFAEDVRNVFIGHTSVTPTGVDVPVLASDIWNVDTGGGWEGKLTIMDIDTYEYWQSDICAILYKDEDGRRI